MRYAIRCIGNFYGNSFPRQIKLTKKAALLSAAITLKKLTKIKIFNNHLKCCKRKFLFLNNLSEVDKSVAHTTESGVDAYISKICYLFETHIAVMS